jgi:hypothetical protein
MTYGRSSHPPKPNACTFPGEKKLESANEMEKIHNESNDVESKVEYLLVSKEVKLKMRYHFEAC